MLLKSNHIELSISNLYDSNLYENGFTPKEEAKGYEYYAYMKGDREKVNSFNTEKLIKNNSIKADAVLEKIHSSYFLSCTDNDLIFPLGSNAYGVTVEQYIGYDAIDSVEAGFGGNSYTNSKPRGIFGKGEYFTSINNDASSKIDYPYTDGNNNYYKEFPYSYKGISSFCKANKNLIAGIEPSGVQGSVIINEVENSHMFISNSIYDFKKDISRVKTTGSVDASFGKVSLSAGNYVFSFFCKTKNAFTVTMGSTVVEAGSDLQNGCYERFVGCFSVDADNTDVEFKINYVGPIRIAGILLEKTDSNMPSPYYKAYHDDSDAAEKFNRKSPLAFSNRKKNAVTVVNFKREVDAGNGNCESREYICGYEVVTGNPEKFENIFAVVGEDGLILYRFNKKGEVIGSASYTVDVKTDDINVVSKNNRQCVVDIILGGTDLENSHPGYYRDLIIYNFPKNDDFSKIMEKSFGSLFEATIIDTPSGKGSSIKSPLIFEGINR